MAISNQGINGGFSGKVGNVIGYWSRGKWIIRSKPIVSAKMKAGSSLQRAFRSRFSSLNAFIKPLLPFIRLGFKNHAEANGQSAYNAAMSHNLKHAFDAEGNLVAEQVCLSYGPLELPIDLQIHKDDAGIHITWEDGPYTSNSLARGNDLLMAVAYNLDTKEVVMDSSLARRNAGNATMLLENAEGYEVWISFVSDDRKWVSGVSYNN